MVNGLESFAFFINATILRAATRRICASERSRKTIATKIQKAGDAQLRERPTAKQDLRTQMFLPFAVPGLPELALEKYQSSLGCRLDLSGACFTSENGLTFNYDTSTHNYVVGIGKHRSHAVKGVGLWSHSRVSGHSSKDVKSL